MAPKKKKEAPVGPSVTHIKFVSKANQWCKTISTGTTQVQTWHTNKPS